MKFKTDAYSDIGTKKSVNQDALLLKQASIQKDKTICFACLCDGMGGLSQGEVASSSFIKRMDEWFNTELPSLLSEEGCTEELNKLQADRCVNLDAVKVHWEHIVQQMNLRIQRYGDSQGIRLGTTVIAILIMNDEYIAMNVGDSRAYRFDSSEIELISHDHSYVQQQIDMGRMTNEEALASDKKSVLLQCIGASEIVEPEFYFGKCKEGLNFLLCSDGLWRHLTTEEIKGIAVQNKGLENLTKIVMERGETDNISSLLISM